MYFLGEGDHISCVDLKSRRVELLREFFGIEPPQDHARHLWMTVAIAAAVTSPRETKRRALRALDGSIRSKRIEDRVCQQCA